MSKPTNTLVVIGYMSQMSAYLNVPVEEAVRRYREREELEPDEPLPDVRVIEFEDEFEAYDIWAVGRKWT